MLCLTPVMVDIPFIKVIMTSNLSFQDFLPTFYCNQLNMLISGKKPAYFYILYFHMLYFIFLFYRC